MRARASHLQALTRFAENSRWLSLIDAEGIERLAENAQRQQFATGRAIVRQGELGDSFYLIVRGEVRVLVSDSDDAEPKEVARLGPGMFFGELAVLSREPRSATVESSEVVDLLRLRRDAVLPILRNYPQAREVLGAVGLQRSEANMDRRLQLLEEQGGGLADLLEGDASAEAEPQHSDAAAARDDESF